VQAGRGNSVQQGQHSGQPRGAGGYTGKMAETSTHHQKQQQRQLHKDCTEFGVIMVCALLIIGGLWSMNSGPLPIFGGGDAECNALNKWLVDNGGMLFNVGCKKMAETGGRGLIVEGHIPYKTTYISVPNHLWMHEQELVANSSIRHVLQRDKVISEQCGATWGATGEPCRLIIAQMYEKTLGDKSWWKPYLDTVPDVPTSPVWWNQTQLEALQAPSVTDQIVTLQTWIKELHAALFPYLTEKYPEHFPAEKFPVELLTWSSLNVWGRSFDCSARDPNDPKRRTWGMIPMADLVNHESYIESFYGDSKGKGPFTCWASECLTEGAQIYQSYGSHRSSTHFFLYYGFVPTYFRSDYIAMRLPGAEWRKVEKAAGVYNKKLVRTRLMGFAGIDGHISEYFLTAYRDVLHVLKIIPEDDWKATQGMKYTLSHILRKMKRYLAGFATTYTQDFDELKKPFETYDKWVMYTFRSRYKYVYEQVVLNLEHRIASEFPSNPQGWMSPKINHLLVYDNTEVGQAHADNNLKDALHLAYVSLPAGADAAAANL